MFKLIRRFIKIPESLRQPEDSKALRWITYVAQLVATLSLVYVTRQIWLLPVGIVLLSFGHYVAYRSRHNPQKWIAWFGALLLTFGLCGVVVAIASGVPYPQASFAVLVMSFVSIEVRSRLNLYSALGLGFVNLYAAATISRDVFYGIFLLVYIAMMLLFLWTADSEDGLKQNRHILRESGTNKTYRGMSISFIIVGLLFTVVAFILTPHYASTPLLAASFSLRVPMESSPNQSVINPAVPLVQVLGSVNTEDSEYFFGFSNSVDLSYRGGLSDTIMMYVSSPAWSYWRGYAYDTFNGQSWSQSNPDVEEIDRADGLFLLQEPRKRDNFLQTFYIVQPMPNILWVGGKPLLIIFPANTLGMDETGGLRIGEALPAGMIYSVYSERVDVPAEELMSDSGNFPQRIREQYLQLPPTITQRTRDLAHQLTDSLPTNYEKVVAIRDYLRNNIPYDFFPPPFDPTGDYVDQFLFIDQRGFCEMYVSSMIVMLREIGIPARFVVGYGAGDFNPITNYYEVRANHAHSWVEVYFADYGWIPFDPTAGWTGDPQTGGIQRWIFSSMFEDVQLPQIRLSAIRDIGAAFLAVAAAPLFYVALFGAALALLFGLWRWWSRLSLTQNRRYHRDPLRRAIFREYKRLQKSLKAPREQSQTVQEHAEANPVLKEIADAVDIAAYRPEPPDKSLLAKIRNWVKSLKKQN